MSDKILQCRWLSVLSLSMVLGLGPGCSANGDGAGGRGDGGGGATGAGTGLVLADDGTDGNGNISGSGDNSDTGFPNDGSVGGAIFEGETLIAGAGSDPASGFRCTQSASSFAGASTEIGLNGLVGSVVSDTLLGALSADTIAALLNGVNDKDLAIDTDLRTAAAMNQSASALDLLLGAGGVDSVDLNVFMPENVTIPAGSYAVFALSFPDSLLDLGLLSQVSVTTLLDGEVQETGALLDTTDMGLLGQSLMGDVFALLGYRVSSPYDQAQLSLSADFLSVDLGESVHVHEMCTAGRLIPQTEG